MMKAVASKTRNRREVGAVVRRRDETCGKEPGGKQAKQDGRERRGKRKE